MAVRATTGNNYLTLPAAQAPAQNGFTAMAWVKWASTAAPGVVFSTQATPTSSGGAGFVFLIDNPNGDLLMGYYAGSAVLSNLVTTPAGSASVGRWVHLATAVVHSGSTALMRVYVNGVLQGTASDTITYPSDTAVSWGLGDANPADTDQAYLRWFRRPLDQGQIRRNMVAGACPADLRSSCTIDLPLVRGTVDLTNRAAVGSKATIVGALTSTSSPPVALTATILIPPPWLLVSAGSANATANAGNASVTVTANNATTTVLSNAAAGNALVTVTANNAAPVTGTNAAAGNALVTVTANDAQWTVLSNANAGNALVTVTAGNAAPTTAETATAGNALVTVTANNATNNVSLSAFPSNALVNVTAFQPTVTGGTSVRSRQGQEIQGSLQRLSSTTLDAQGAANQWAGVSGKELVAAINVKAVTVGLEFNGAVKDAVADAGVTAVLDAQGGLDSI